MREFFGDSNRRIGLEWLVLAIIILMGWMRSRVIVDTSSLFSGDQMQWYAQSSNEALILAGFVRSAGMDDRQFYLDDSLRKGRREGFERRDDIQWRVRCLGFCIGRTKDHEEQNRTIDSSTRNRVALISMYILVVPYWLIVMPPTVLSAWYLLRNSKKQANECDKSSPRPLG